MAKPFRGTRSSRRHMVGVTRWRYVIENHDPVLRFRDAIYWIANDQNGDELEVLVIEKDDAMLVVHAMPTKYRA